MKELREGMGSSNYYLISSLGVIWSIKKEWRYIPLAFCGMTLFDLMMGAITATLDSFLQHYSTDSAVEITLTTTTKNL